MVDCFMKVLSKDLGQSARTCYRNFHHVAGIAACHDRNPDASKQMLPFYCFCQVTGSIYHSFTTTTIRQNAALYCKEQIDFKPDRAVSHSVTQDHSLYCEW